MIGSEFIINTLSLGSLYALIALGLVFVYGILKLVNFAYGEYLMVAGYTLYVLGTFTPIPWWLTMILAVALAAFVSYLTELIAFRPVRTKSLDAMLVTSFAVSVLLQNAALLFVSPRSRAVPFPPAFSESVTVFGATTPVRNILTIVTTVILLVALTLLMKYTVLGIAMRAAADKFTTTRLMGVPANLVISVAFILSGLLAGVVSIFWVGRSASVDPLIGFAPLLIAFIATVIGGMHSLQGAVVGGYVYGLLFNALSIMLPASLINYRDAFMFAIVILFLLLRPEGLIRGGYTEERVG
ncbi:MAG: branched-chain amino acid ABC transporter permease [Actinobacteria bacterium HGW-Actinobacteria-7]|jgi:branched-chain amino acid transport system permease protein|nr:MAG: branched-chain amino acid ABC transporter permease [Actinobacteria bacterium HGW-Actinobacteria-7]